MNKTYTSAEEVERAFISLYEECCDTCLWFWRRNGLPDSTAGRMEVLRQIEQNGTAHQYAKARELRKWL
jgi:uncharacterized protein YutE (UPF0331/DUF86 family)